MAILFTIYTLRFAAKSATCGYGIYVDVKSKSVVLRALICKVSEFIKRKVEICTDLPKFRKTKFNFHSNCYWITALFWRNLRYNTPAECCVLKKHFLTLCRCPIRIVTY